MTGTLSIDDIHELGEWLTHAKIGWGVTNILLLIAVLRISSAQKEDIEKQTNNSYFYYDSVPWQSTNFTNKNEFSRTSSGSQSKSKNSSNPKVSSWFSDGNSRSDYNKGREDAWHDCYIYGDSHKFDTGRSGGSKSYNDGYNGSFLDGDD